MEKINASFIELKEQIKDILTIDNELVKLSLCDLDEILAMKNKLENVKWDDQHRDAKIVKKEIL